MEEDTSAQKEAELQKEKDKKPLNPLITWGLGAIVVALLAAGAWFLYDQYGTNPNSSNTDSEEQDTSLPADEDTDSDGLINSKEEFYGSDPNDPDSDNDGYSDGEEVDSGFNPIGAGKLNTEDNQEIGDFSGISLEEVFTSGGTFLCQMSLDQQELPMKVTLKVKDQRVRQELRPNFPDQNNEELETVVLIVNGDNVFFGNGDNENGWLKLEYNAEDGSWSSPGVTITGGLFTSAEEILKAEPDKVECLPAEIEDSEFIIPPQYIVEPSASYEEYQQRLQSN